MPRQDSTTDQLASVQQAATERGLAGAAWVTDPTQSITFESYQVVWLLAIKMGCYDAADALKRAWCSAN